MTQPVQENFQLSLPAGFAADGSGMVTLRDLISHKTEAVDFPALSPEKKAELTIARIQLQPHFKLGMVGAGIIDKERAIQEVKNQTAIGKSLVEIEQRTIRRALRVFAAA